MKPLTLYWCANQRLIRALVGGFSVILIGACAATSSLVNVWKDPDFPSTPMHNVLIVAMKSDATMRRIWEDGLATELSRGGVTATPSYKLFADAPPDTHQVADAVHAHDYDGVFEAYKLPTETTQHYILGYVTTQPVTRYNRWTQSYQTHYREVVTPGYTATEKIVRYQLDVWSMEEPGLLVWSGTTETFDPTSGRDVSRQISRLIVPELARTRVIPKPAK